MTTSAARQAAAVVVMGVSGCGKTTIGQLLAHHLGWQFVEGDAFHSDDNRTKMQAGIPLTDADRHSWLNVLGRELAAGKDAGVVLSCSALKRAYRQQLRDFVPDLRFVWLDVARDAAQTRVASRGNAHFFPATLIDNQFQTLEPPDQESRLLRVDGQDPPINIVQSAALWLAQTT
ncbi:gluconokinase [Alcaligenaceae bacterium]|nr:gluconokinase [Alcaligenaceae bacterium]